MSMFESRERAFEAKFAHDGELRFRVTARRDKLFAHVVTEQLGLSDDAGRELTAAVLATPDGPGHDAALLAHMAQVLVEHGRGVNMTELVTSLDGCALQAKAQLLATPQA